MEVSPSAPKPVAPASPAPTPEEVTAPAPMFASFHTLLKRVTDRSELPTDHVWIRDKERVLQELDIRTISEARLPAFHKAVAEGRVYAFWGHRFVEFDDLEGDWHLLGKRSSAAAPEVPGTGSLRPNAPRDDGKNVAPVATQTSLL